MKRKNKILKIAIICWRYAMGIATLLWVIFITFIGPIFMSDVLGLKVKEAMDNLPIMNYADGRYYVFYYIIYCPVLTTMNQGGEWYNVAIPLFAIIFAWAILEIPYQIIVRSK